MSGNDMAKGPSMGGVNPGRLFMGSCFSLVATSVIFGVVTSLMGGTILVAIAVLGEYVWRTLDEVRDRPRFLERSYVAVNPEEGGAGPVGPGQKAE